MIGDFALYRDLMKCIIPWFFALDHYHYARWLSIHWYDMATLDQTNRNTLVAFNNGDFVITRIQNPFSSMGIDQCHKQLNTIFKGDGGALGITEDEEKFRKRMVCGLEIAKMVKGFEHVTILRMRTHNFAIMRTLQGFKGGSTIIIQV